MTNSKTVKWGVMKAGTALSRLALAVVFLLAGTAAAKAEDLKPIPLMQIRLDTGRPLMHVLKERKSARAFSARMLPKRVLSNLLWAANGVNRSASGGRTAPSARNQQEIDVFVATAEGLYLYDAKGHQLQPVLNRDIRALTGFQDYVREAPLNLVFVADFARMTGTPPENRDVVAAADTGFISQNVYLYCASEGLATVVRSGIDRDALAEAMKLGPEQRIILAQSVGYPIK
jgi:SagB-type dehydrogenase family enzyme